MNTKILALSLSMALVALTGCSSRSQAGNTNSPDNTVAMQKRYNSQAECQRDFPTAGDCTRTTVSGTNGVNHGGGFFMSPFFYPWGGIYHSNGSMSYNNRVPTSGYSVAPANAQRLVASKANFSNVPKGYTGYRSASTGSSSSTVRGGFGSSGRSSAS
jgi:hypothetical protein